MKALPNDEAERLGLNAAGPLVFADWVPLFERFGKGDDGALDEMQRGRIVLTASDIPRWLHAASAAVRQRFGHVSASLRAQLDGSVGGAGIVASLDWTRAQLAPLYRFCCLPALPDGVQAHLDDECRGWVEHTQAAIELSAAHVDDQGLLALIVRRIPLLWPPTTRAGNGE